VSPTPVINHTEILPLVVTTGDKMITGGVVDTDGKFIADVNDTGDKTGHIFSLLIP